MIEQSIAKWETLVDEAREGEEMETVLCKFCGKPTTFDATELCTNCYEVTARLGEFVKSEAGQAWVFRTLGAVSPLLEVLKSLLADCEAKCAERLFDPDLLEYVGQARAIIATMED